MPEKQTNRMSFLGVVLLLCVVSGALAGVVASVTTNRSLHQYLLTLREGEELVRISQVKPRPLPGTYEEALARVQEDGWKALATVRPRSVDSVVSSDWFVTTDVSGTGAIIANDGWIVFHKEAFATFTYPETQAEIWIAETRYPIERYVEDDLSALALVKVDAKDLPTLAFGASDSMTGGEMIFALPSVSEVAVFNLLNAQARIAPLVLPAEMFEQGWELTNEPKTPSPLFNSGGELVGFASASDAFAEPLHHGTAFIQSVLRDEMFVHAALGAYIVNIDAAQNIDALLIGSARSGALVVKGGRSHGAVLPNGPAAQAGIQEGDILLSVDGSFITAENTLSELLAMKRPGSVTMITVLRGTETFNAQATLADFADLVY